LREISRGLIWARDDSFLRELVPDATGLGSGVRFECPESALKAEHLPPLPPAAAAAAAAAATCIQATLVVTETTRAEV
jgi:hypothetical protein